MRYTFVVILAALLVSASLQRLSGAENPSRETFALERQLRRQGRNIEAERVLTQAISAGRKSLPDLRLANLLNELGIVEHDLGRYTEAEKALERSLIILKRLRPMDDPALVRALTSLAAVYAETNQFGRLRQIRKDCLKLRPEALGATAADMAQLFNIFGSVSYIQGKFSEAEAMYRRSLKIQETFASPGSPGSTAVLNNLALVCDRTGHLDKAAWYYKKALRVAQKAPSSDLSEIVKVQLNLAGIYRRTGRLAEAESLLKQTREFAETVLGPHHPLSADVLDNYAAVLRRLKRKHEAHELEMEAKAIRQDDDRVLFAQHEVDVSTLLDSQHKRTK